MMTERKRRFCVEFMKHAVGGRAAEEAGYSKRRAVVTASELLRDPDVVAYLESHRIKRDAHADVTYRNLVALANLSMKTLQETLQDPGAEFKDRIIAYENARRCNETAGRCEGLMVELPRRTDEAAMTLQMLAQKLRTNLVPEEVEVPRLAQVEVREVEIAPEASPLTPDASPLTQKVGAA